METPKEAPPSPADIDAAAKEFVREAGCPACEASQNWANLTFRVWLLGIVTGICIADFL